MSVTIPEGDYQAVPTNFAFGTDEKKNNAPFVSVTMKIVEGPCTGKTAEFKNGFGDKAVKYTRRALVALGWAGKDINTAKDDIMKSPKAVPIQIVIAEYEDRQWSSVRSIGAYVPTLKPADKSTVNDVNQWLSDAADEGEPSVPF